MRDVRSSGVRVRASHSCQDWFGLKAKRAGQREADGPSPSDKGRLETYVWAGVKSAPSPSILPPLPNLFRSRVLGVNTSSSPN